MKKCKIKIETQPPNRANKRGSPRVLIEFEEVEVSCLLSKGPLRGWGTGEEAKSSVDLGGETVRRGRQA